MQPNLKKRVYISVEYFTGNKYMDDKRIIELFFERNTSAINECKTKYSRYLLSIAYNIVRNNEDSEECVNDTYLKAWDTIPPRCPDSLKLYLAKIARNFALNLMRKLNTLKRGGGTYDIVLDELCECIADTQTVESIIEEKELALSINRFLEELEPGYRKIFVQRYWYMYSVSKIAKAHKLSESATKSALFRIRNKLKEHLTKDGIQL